MYSIQTKYNKKWCDLVNLTNVYNDTVHILILYRHIKTEQQRTIIQQYGDLYTGPW